MNKFKIFILFIILQYIAPALLNAQKISANTLESSMQNSLGAEISKIKNNMVYVEGGEFTMGCLNPNDTDCHDNEIPAHKVQVNSFYINKYDVTVHEFELFVNETGYKTDADKQGYSFIYTNGAWTRKNGVNWRYNAHGIVCTEEEKNNPVVHVSWNDAQAFTQWLSSKTGDKFRLAAEAEWEFAAKGGNKSHGYIYAGSNNIDSVGWYNANCDSSTHPVGLKMPNELGLYDMSGNVWQMCNDWYVENYYKNSPVNNPKGPKTGTSVMIRGGSWRKDASRCRVTSRHYELPDARHSNLGFRVAADATSSH